MPNQVNIIGIYDNCSFSAPIEYTFSLMLSIYGVSHRVVSYSHFKQGDYDLDKTLVISYGREYLDTSATKQIHIYASDLFGEDYLKPSSMPISPLSRYKILPVIYSGRSKLDDLVRKSDKLIETDIDIIASSFFMLSRYEEVILNTKDEHDRFPAKASLAYQEGFLGRPVVNEYIELLWSWIHSLMPELERKPFWPENKEFAVCLTHDVDSVQKYSFLPPAISIGSAIVQQKNPGLAFYMLKDYLASLLHLKKDPFDTFDYMLDVERRYGLRSSFYFMSGGSSKFDGNYSITKPRIKRLIQKIEGKGCEVGLHGSYDSYNDSKRMASEKDRLDTVVDFKSYGYRQHYLRFRVPESWRIQESAGLLYDTTLTFADHVGFRSGFCLPFRPFDILENRVLDIWELPLTVMEGSLQNPNYQNLSPKQGFEEIIKLIEVLKEFKGIFVVLWHNSSFDPSGGWVGWKEIYEKVMRYISEQNAWIAPGREIVEWWQGNTAAQVPDCEGRFTEEHNPFSKVDKTQINTRKETQNRRTDSSY